MANIIRCELPDKVRRYKPFTVRDYRDFILVRVNLEDKPPEEQHQLIDELTLDYFDDLPKTWRHYVFLMAFTGSIGKTKIPIVYECPVCGKRHKRIFNISQSPMINPEIEISEDIKLKFKMPEEMTEDTSKLVVDHIVKVIQHDTEYNWGDLSTESKDSVLDLIDFTKFEEIIKALKPFHFELKMRCCETTLMVYDDLCSIFKLLINPDEVFPFYEINHILAKNNYDPESIMNMLPIERSIALSLIEKDNKK